MFQSRALIIDDVPEVRNVLKHMLHNLGLAKITECKTGRKALSICNEHRFDYIFLDIELEQENGIELIPDIKEIAPDAAIIMCSSYADADHVKSAVVGGAKGFVAKPFTLNNIKSSMENIKLRA